jgi:hypothetical protein
MTQPHDGEGCYEVRGFGSPQFCVSLDEIAIFGFVLLTVFSQLLSFSVAYKKNFNFSCDLTDRKQFQYLYNNFVYPFACNLL